MPFSRVGAIVDSCYLCVIGGATLPAQGSRTASEGFGTCNGCGVHACQIHGDIIQGQTYFRCADCLTRLGLVTAVTASPPIGGAGTTLMDPGLYAFLNRSGPLQFPAIAPLVTNRAVPLVAEANLDAMGSALVTLIGGISRDRPESPTDMVDLWDRSRPENPGQALGLRDAANGQRAQRIVDHDLGTAMITMATETLLREVSGWQFRSADDAYAQQNLATWALATAYAARGAESLGTNPFLLFGGLRMPPIALLLATTYWAQLPR